MVENLGNETGCIQKFQQLCEHINEHFTFHKIVEFFIANGKAVCVRTVKEHVGVVL
jgi:hypothetical protein